MNKEEAIERFNGIINAMSISIAQSKFYPSKAELNELCEMAIEALSERPKGEWKCMADCGVTECDQCGWNVEEYVGDYNFCPNCGAKMHKGGDDE